MDTREWVLLLSLIVSALALWNGLRQWIYKRPIEPITRANAYFDAAEKSEDLETQVAYRAAGEAILKTERHRLTSTHPVVAIFWSWMMAMFATVCLAFAWVITDYSNVGTAWAVVFVLMRVVTALLLLVILGAMSWTIWLELGGVEKRSVARSARNALRSGK